MKENNNEQENKDTQEIKKLIKEYKLLKMIGKGSFGEVYLSMHRKKKKDVAIKVQGNSGEKDSELKREYAIYMKMMKAGINEKYTTIPKIFEFKESTKYSVLIMELMDKSLEDLYNENRFDMNTILLVGYQCITLIEQLHNIGFIHRDIKPNNFMLNSNKNRLQLIDFGLSKQYEKNGAHIKIKNENGHAFIGTLRYASVNVHMKLEPSRRDDLESIGFMILYFVLGKLPWQGLKPKENQDQTQLVGSIKITTNFEKLCENIPKCFYEYIKMCRKLEFNEKPDYEGMKKLFMDEYIKNNKNNSENIELNFIK